MIDTKAIRQNQAIVERELREAQKQLDELKMQLSASGKRIADHYESKKAH